MFRSEFTFVKKQITMFNVLIKPIPTDLSGEETQWGVKHVGKAESQLTAETATEPQWEKRQT